MHNSSFFRIGETNSRHGFGRLQSLLLCSVLVLSSLMLSATLGRGENLLTNGSFESPLLATNSHLWLSNGNSGLTGWTIGGVAGTLALENGFLPGTIGPVDGAQCVVFNGGMNPTRTSISQTFGTEVGQTYVVSFKVGKEGGAPGNMRITAAVTASAGVVLGSLAGTQSTTGWGPTEAFFFTATTAASTLTLVDTSSTTIDTDVALDNVSVLPIGPITNGLVAYYPFNGNANDESGHGNDGVVVNATLTADRFGITNSAYFFNGSTGKITISSFSVRTNCITLSFWFNTAGSVQCQRILSHSWDFGTQGAFSTDVDHYGGIFRGTPDSSVFGLYLNTSVPIGTWEHWTLSYDGNTGRFYVNGVEKVVSQSDLALKQVTTELYIGGDLNCHFHGAIDDVRIYNRALSDSEVQQLYHFESSTCPVPFITSQPRGQVGYWGKSVTLGVTAVTNTPLSYQWLKDGTPVEGASGSSLILTNLQATNAGNYSVVVSNACGSTTSSNAYLTVNPAGVSLALYAGITIDGVVGLTYGIQCNTNLSNTNGWWGVVNVTLSTATELWFDVQPANQPRRYYRVVPGPIPIP